MTFQLLRYSLGNVSCLVLACCVVAGMPRMTSAAEPEPLKFFANNTDKNDRFGGALAIAGNQAIVGAPGGPFPVGSAYLFNLPEGQQQTILTPSIPVSDFGFSVDIDNTRAIVGAINTSSPTSLNVGSVHVFDSATGVELWNALSPADERFDEFGGAVAIEGSYALIGARGEGLSEGAAYVYDAATGVQQNRLTPTDAANFRLFGSAVAISGNTGLVGAETSGAGTGSAYLFDLETGTETFKLTSSLSEGADRFGNSAAVEGDLALVGAVWQDGDQMIRSGAAFLFDVNDGSEIFSFVPDDLIGGSNFGASVTLWNDLALIGAPGDDDNGDRAGAVYVFDTTSGEQLAKILAFDGDGGDEFGNSVALNSLGALVGAYFDDERGTKAGAAYFTPVPEPSTLTMLVIGVLTLGMVHRRRSR